MLSHQDGSTMEDNQKNKSMSQNQKVKLAQSWQKPFVCLAFCALLGITTMSVYGYISVTRRLGVLEERLKTLPVSPVVCPKCDETADRTKRSSKQANVNDVYQKLTLLENRLNKSCQIGLQKTMFMLRGRDGRDGMPGTPGANGQDGTDGKDGAKGQKGATSILNMQNGPRGLPGQKGARGSPGTTGVTYIRWGRKSCPKTGAALVYEGIVGGSHYTESGSGANYVCLPKNPIYGKYQNGKQNYRARMYGAEYESSSFGILPSKLHNHEVPCAQCHVDSRASRMMIPGRNVCPPGWILEYKGYLMAEASKYHRTMFTCVDENPEYIHGTQANKDGVLFHFVEGRCGSLPCGPFIDGRELTCAVCTR